MRHQPALSARAPAFVVLLAAVAIHAGTLWNGFVWDDEAIVVSESRSVGQVLLSPDEVAPYYRPLSRASYLLDRALWGQDPRGYHAVNLALHAGCALLLYLLARRLFSSTAPAMVAALLLAVHPIHVEAVAFVTARNNLLALFFSLAAVLLFLRRQSALSGVAVFLALASKEQGAMVVPVIAACALFPRELTGEDAARSWRRIVPHAVAGGVYLVLRGIALHGAAAAPGTGTALRHAASGFADYLRLVVWPRDLTIFHREPVPSWSDLFPWLGLGALLIWLLRRPPPAARLGALWLAFGVVPLAGVVPIPSATVAERYVYAVLPGLWLLLAEAAQRIPRKAALPILSLIALLLAARTIQRTRDWHDDVRLAASAVEVDSASARARFNLGVALKDSGDLPAAEREWTAALRLEPEDAETMTQLGTAAAVRGDLAQAEALFRRALARRPGLAMAALNLARICERTGRPEEARALEAQVRGRP